MLDRTLAPAFRQVERVLLQEPVVHQLSNGTPVYLVDAGTQDLVKIEWIFDAGLKRQHSPLIAAGANDMLDEGTPSRNAMQIAEQLDYYGAFIESEVSNDRASFMLFTLNKHLASTMPVVEDLLRNAAYPEKEYGVYLNNKRQKFLVDSAKVATLARREFMPLLFGPAHPFGRVAIETDFDRLQREQLIEFHRNHYKCADGSILVSGKIPDNMLSLLEQYFGKDQRNEPTPAFFPEPLPSTVNLHTITKDDAIQSAIRMGRILFNRTHPDFIGMQVLNTVLGGYFGSRLMTNIREDKGYTYGIGSAVVSMEDAGYFVISTEVGVEVTNKALTEIETELRLLCDDLIPESELDLVRNYMIGTFLRSTDGPFALADRFKALYGYGALDYSYYQRYIDTVKTISADTLRTLAQRYLDPKDLLQLVVGKRS